MTTSAPASAAATPSLRGVLVFVVATLGMTWLLQTPALLAHEHVIAGPPERYMALVGLGAFGPVLAAVLAARFESGSEGVRALFRTLRTPVGAIWYVVALLLFPAIYVAGTAIYTLVGGSGAGRWFYPPENAPQVVAMFVFPLAEEPGWRGYALPRLQERYGALLASLIVGGVWAVWHVMMFILADTGSLALAFVNVALGSVVFTWLYNRTRGSLLVAIVAHVGAHLSNPSHALPSNPTAFTIYTVAIGVTAIALLLGDRRAWRAK